MSLVILLVVGVSCERVAGELCFDRLDCWQAGSEFFRHGVSDGALPRGYADRH